MGNASMCFSARALIAAVSLVLSLVVSATCWGEAGRGCGIDPLLLRAIVWKESRGWTGAVGPKLKDGNRAPGLMQIDAIHLSNPTRFGIHREHLFDARTSQKVGVWVLTDCIQRFDITWRSVGYCYAGPASINVSAQAEYVRDVQRFYEGCRGQQIHQISASPAQVTSFQED